MQNRKWYEIEGTRHLITPSLLVYPDRIKENIETMIAIAGGPERLRPHVKTHKIAEIITMQMAYGIDKFKCATIAEAELLAQCGAQDILLAAQPVGPNIDRLFELMTQFPNSQFSTIVDHQEITQQIATIATSKKRTVDLWLDINNGMNRTGILPNEQAISLYKFIDSHANLTARGLHVYDGHINISDSAERKQECDKAFEHVLKLKTDLKQSGFQVDTIVAGGTPTFPIHIKRSNVEVSPGTPLLWDQGYADKYDDLPFLTAAVLLGRIISKPSANHICLDLGHKAVAAEMNFPRVKLLGMEYSEQVKHSEEHLVITGDAIEKYSVGDICYAIPTHICPTVIKYENVLTVRGGKIDDTWAIPARNYKTTI